MRAYFDYAATAPVRPSVKEAVLPTLDRLFGNPSSLYKEGQEARFAVEMARQQVATSIGADAAEITFTSGGTESNHWALSALFEKGRQIGKTHMIISAVEHPSVLRTAKWLESSGASLTILPVTSEGVVSPETLCSSIREDTFFCSIMWVNNELGSISPMEELSLICKNAGVFFHVDAVQALGALTIDVHHLPVDCLSLSAHKIGGLKGTGALYIRNSLELPSLFHGGAQEREKRAGTENVPGIVAFGKAAEENAYELPKHQQKTKIYQEKIIETFEMIPGVSLNSPQNAISSILNFQVEGISNENLLARADMAGLSFSAGSACSSGSLEPSPVLLALGCTPEVANSSFRLSMGYGTTEYDIDFLLKTLPPLITQMRKK